MATNNQAIAHISLKNGGSPLCGTHKAIICVTIDRFASETKVCKRCEIKAIKKIDLAKRNAERNR